MASLEAVNTCIARAQEEIESEEYESAEEFIKEANDGIEKLSQIDTLMLQSIKSKINIIIEMLKVVNSKNNSNQQPSTKEATISPAQIGTILPEAVGRGAENVNIFGHVDSISDLATQLAIDCVEKPSEVTFDDIVGLDNLKESIRENIIYRYELPELYCLDVKEKYQSYLFYGPPGVSKSAASKATVNEIRRYIKNVYRVKPDVIHGQTWKGQTLKVVKALFVMMRQKKPSMLIIGR